jgi:hypothetical protein
MHIQINTYVHTHTYASARTAGRESEPQGHIPPTNATNATNARHGDKVIVSQAVEGVASPGAADVRTELAQITAAADADRAQHETEVAEEKGMVVVGTDEMECIEALLEEECVPGGKEQLGKGSRRDDAEHDSGHGRTRDQALQAITLQLLAHCSQLQKDMSAEHVALEAWLQSAMAERMEEWQVLVEMMHSSEADLKELEELRRRAHAFPHVHVE